MADVIEQLDLEVILDSTIGTLSKGQRKRALLAIGLLMPRPMLLVDEPFDGLDLRQSRDVAQTLRAHAAARPDDVPVDSPDQRRRARVRPVRPAERRPRLRRGDARRSCPALAAARSGAPAADDLEEVFLALT